MKINQPLYELITVDEHEWRFHDSPEMFSATDRFDEIWENYQGSKYLARHLKKFLSEYPRHIDGWAHYANYKIDIGQNLDGYAYAQTAVALGKSVFPKEFQYGRDELPSGFIQNRPFLRAMNALRIAQVGLGDIKAAIQTSYEHMGFDLEDRTGIRMILPSYLMEEGRDGAAMEVFSKPEFKDSFYTAEYLKALLLFRSQRIHEAQKSLTKCLSYYPQVARFILDIHAEQPENNSLFGITSGSPFEGWFYGRQYAVLWRTSKGAIEFLKKAAKPYAANNWDRYQTL